MIKELLKDHRLYHSKFQQDNFITGSQGTVYGQYKQALRELYRRLRGLRETICDKEKLLVEIEEQKYLMENGETEFIKKYAAIEHKRKIMQIEESERVIKDTKREFKRFYEQAVGLKEKIGDLTEEKIEKFEEELYIYKVEEMMITDWLCNGGYTKQTHEMLCALPLNVRNKLLEQAKSKEGKDKLIEFHLNQENFSFNEIDIDISKLLEV